MGSNRDLARQFFEAAATGGDWKSACAPDCVVSQNGGEDRPLIAVLEGFQAALGGKMPPFHFEEQVLVETENGFVEEHLSCSTLPDGTALRMPVVVVGVVKDGKIVSVHEYFDSAAAAPLVRALS